MSVSDNEHPRRCQVIYVDDEEWDFIQELLAEPARDLPRLRELFNAPRLFNQEDQ